MPRQQVRRSSDKVGFESVVHYRYIPLPSFHAARKHGNRRVRSRFTGLPVHAPDRGRLWQAAHFFVGEISLFLFAQGTVPEHLEQTVDIVSRTLLVVAPWLF